MAPQSEAKGTIPRLDHAAVQDELQRGAQYLDVRTPEEYALGHIPSALNLPWAFGGLAGFTRNPEFLTAARALLAKTTHLVVGCHSGGRASQAAELLAEDGYCNVQIHADSWGGRSDAFGQRSPGWLAAGYPAEGAAPPTRTS